jgi:micrococcal nuclease
LTGLVRPAVAATLLLLPLLAGCSDREVAPLAGDHGVARSTADGDTIRLRDGRAVRLVQIDAPERDECYGRAAGRVLAGLLPRGTDLLLVRDPSLDDRDEYGRLLRYVQPPGEPRPETSVNVELVRVGAAVPYFFRGDRGLVADELLDAVEDARRDRRGLWGACPGARLDPRRGSLTGPA